MRLFGVLPCQPEAHVDRVDGGALPQQIGDEHGAVDPTAGEDGHRGRRRGRRRLDGAHASPRYTQPEVHVSRTTTCDSSGSAGCTRSQIQRASTSLVGFSRPSISFR